MFGSTIDYSFDSLYGLIDQLKNAAVINKGHEVRFLNQNSRVTSLENDLNNPKTTLICKGGCGFRCILPRFNEEGLKFGGIIIVNDPMSVDGLDQLLDSLEYHRVAALQPERVVSGWAIPIHKASVFLKKNVNETITT